MGTSLSGLTPATTFDGLLKTSDNEPLDGTLKAISTGDGTDTMLELSTSALQIGGATGMYWDNTNKRLGINNTSPAAPLEVNGEIRSTSLIRLMIGGSNKVLMQNANTVINSDVAIGQAAAPSARLHIKGSGATSATTSLLVQNSAGTDLFKVVDDNTMFYHTHKFRSAGGYLYIECEGNVDRSLKIGPAFTATSYSGHIFKTWDGTAFSEAMRITGNTNQFVGIGETTPTARLHVKGSGNTNTTTSLLVQNSDATELLKVLDDGATTIKSNGSFSFETVAGTKRIEVKANGEVTLKGGQLAAYSNYNSSNSSLIVGSFTSPTARLQVKGSGATSATTALLVQNSAGTELLKVQDNGEVGVKYGDFRIPSYKSIYGGGSSTYAITLEGTAGMNFKSWAKDFIFNTQNGTIATLKNDGKFGLGETTPTAKLQVKGSGNDATTTALLVQNSDGAELLSLDDVGGVRLGGDGNTTTKANIKLDAYSGLFNVTAAKFGNWNGAVYAVFSGLAKTDALFAFGNDATTASTRMHVKGLGATSATTALLVENSAGTEALKVRDDGKIFFNGLNLVIEGKQIYNANTTNGFLKLNSNRLEYSDSSTSGLDSSAALTVTSTTRGFLPPRMTTTERDAISTPAAGLMVYNTTTNKAQCYNGTAWQDLF